MKPDTNDWENKAKKDWNRILSYKSSDRTHKSEVDHILRRVQFDCFIDCGPGTVGSEAWSIYDNDNNCKIIGLEPQPDRLTLLKTNGYPGKLLNCAVSNKNGTMIGYNGHKDGKSDFWLVGGEELVDVGAYNKVEIETTTIKRLIEENNLTNNKIFIWADIEGSEMLLLEGCEEYLQSKTIVGFNLELWPETEQNSYTRNEVINYLNKQNYKSIHNSGNDFIFINEN